MLPRFTVSEKSRRGRLGSFEFQNGIKSISTPFMFPVASTVTGTTANGGGIWRYVLQAYPETYDEDASELKSQSLMRRGTPILSQVLQFLDYGVSPSKVQYWRDESIRKMYNDAHTMDYRAPIFLDSGGFKLMWREGLDLDAYGIDLSKSAEARSISQLQYDLGADIIASLDYPIPPNLAPAEARERMKRSRMNAIRVARDLRDKRFPGWRPFFYMPVHGLSPESITYYIEQLFGRIRYYDLEGEPLGIAIGSLVPLRFSRTNLYKIIEIVNAAVNAIPERLRDQIPVHVFGVTGTVLPYLAYCGVDTFDSSTYVKEAINLKYMDPDTRAGHAVLEMTEDSFHCQCDICRYLNLREVQVALATDSKGKPLPPHNHHKSKYYADIALHNLEQDIQIVRETRDAINQDCMNEYIIQMTERFPRMRYALDALCQIDDSLKGQVSRVLQPIEKPLKKTSPKIYQTFTHTADDFDLARMNGNLSAILTPPRIALLLPCSADKPYSTSRTHSYVERYLEEYFPEQRNRIHKVSLSGLYGPVPEDYESYEPILNYNYRLTPENQAQIKLVSKRLLDYLEAYRTGYTHYVAYATSKAYRIVFERVAEDFKELTVLPSAPKSRRLTEFFRATNIQELVQFIDIALNTDL
ncbi:MAG: tRNA-guanine transglycosylase [Aggregatilineales bacterium]